MHTVRPITLICLLSPIGVYCIFYFILVYFIYKKKYNEISLLEYDQP